MGQPPQKSAKEKLLDKKKALEDRIKAMETREREGERKQDTRRKILAGSVVLEEAGKRPEFKQALWELLDRFLVRPMDRKLFELVAEAPQGAGAEREGGAGRIEQAADAIEAGIAASG